MSIFDEKICCIKWRFSIFTVNFSLKFSQKTLQISGFCQIFFMIFVEFFVQKNIFSSEKKFLFFGFSICFLSKKFSFSVGFLVFPSQKILLISSVFVKISIIFHILLMPFFIVYLSFYLCFILIFYLSHLYVRACEYLRTRARVHSHVRAFNI